MDSGNQQQQQQQQQQQHQQDSTPPATSTSATLSSPDPGAAPASGAPLQLFIARDVRVGKSECGNTVAVDSEGVVRGSVVGSFDTGKITRIASALRCTPGQPRPEGSEEWDADSGASAMMSNNKKGMYNIRHPTDQYIQIGDSGLIRVEAIGDINLVFHQLDEHGNPEDVVARVQDVIYTPWLGFNLSLIHI